MKTRLTVPIVLALIAASALAGCSKSESKVAFTDLPPAVQAAIKIQVGDVPVDKIEIEKETEKGQTTYEVETKKDGKKVEFKMDSDGKVIESKVAFTDLPPAVQAAIKVQVGDVPVDKIEIEKETEKGQTMYEVETKKDGKKVEFKMDSDGKVITHD